MNRLSIYASLGVPEIWRYQKGKVAFLDHSGSEYREVERSIALPLVTPADLERWLEMRSGMGETSWIRQFRRWIREESQ